MKNWDNLTKIIERSEKSKDEATRQLHYINISIDIIKEKLEGEGIPKDIIDSIIVRVLDERRNIEDFISDLQTDIDMAEEERENC